VPVVAGWCHFPQGTVCSEIANSVIDSV
jgi:hypothetical protein